MFDKNMCFRPSFWSATCIKSFFNHYVFSDHKHINKLIKSLLARSCLTHISLLKFCCVHMRSHAGVLEEILEMGWQFPVYCQYTVESGPFVKEKHFDFYIGNIPTFYISICIWTLPTQHTTFISIFRNNYIHVVDFSFFQENISIFFEMSNFIPIQRVGWKLPYTYRHKKYFILATKLSCFYWAGLSPYEQVLSMKFVLCYTCIYYCTVLLNKYMHMYILSIFLCLIFIYTVVI